MLANDMNIPIIYTDKGELNNLTENRPHQVGNRFQFFEIGWFAKACFFKQKNKGVVLRASPLKTVQLESLPESSPKE